MSRAHERIESSGRSIDVWKGVSECLSLPFADRIALFTDPLTPGADENR